MKQTRMLGNYVEHKAKEKEKSTKDLSQLLGCEEFQIKAFFKGRLLLSYSKFMKLANYLELNPQDMLNGDEEEYNNTVVHCMGKFSNDDNREKILDIIDMYLDVKNAAYKND